MFKLGFNVFVLIGAAAVLSGCGPASSTPFSGEKAFAETEGLVAVSPRNAGTGNGRLAAVYLENRLKEFGLKTVIDTFSDETPTGKLFFNNVLGRLPGKTRRLIVLISHFDTQSGISPDFQGTNDSGSSPGVLLELARVLATRAPLETDLLIAFLDGEACQVEYGPQDGLHGSRRLARQMVCGGGAELAEGVILLDRVGDKDLNITVPRNCSKVLIDELFEAAHQAGARPVFSLGKGAVFDDHVPFFLKGMPAIDLIDFKFGSAPGLNDYWHTKEDTLDKLSVSSLQTVGNVVLQMVENMQ